MVTINKVEEFTKRNGKKGWRFFLSDGKEGFITNDKPWEYQEGEKVDYTLEVKKSPKGEYNLFTLTRVGEEIKEQSAPPQEPTETKSAASRAKVSLTPAELLSLKISLRKEVIRVIGQAAASGHIEPKEMPDYYNDFYLATDASLDELCE